MSNAISRGSISINISHRFLDPSLDAEEHLARPDTYFDPTINCLLSMDTLHCATKHKSSMSNHHRSKSSDSQYQPLLILPLYAAAKDSTDKPFCSAGAPFKLVIPMITSSTITFVLCRSFSPIHMQLDYYMPTLPTPFLWIPIFQLCRFIKNMPCFHHFTRVSIYTLFYVFTFPCLQRQILTIVLRTSG